MVDMPNQRALSQQRRNPLLAVPASVEYRGGVRESDTSPAAHQLLEGVQVVRSGPCNVCQLIRAHAQMSGVLALTGFEQLHDALEAGPRDFRLGHQDEVQIEHRRCFTRALQSFFHLGRPRFHAWLHLDQPAALVAPLDGEVRRVAARLLAAAQSELLGLLGVAGDAAGELEQHRHLALQHRLTRDRARLLDGSELHTEVVATAIDGVSDRLRYDGCRHARVHHSAAAGGVERRVHRRLT